MSARSFPARTPLVRRASFTACTLISLAASYPGDLAVQASPIGRGRWLALLRRYRAVASGGSLRGPSAFGLRVQAWGFGG